MSQGHGHGRCYLKDDLLIATECYEGKCIANSNAISK